MKDVNNSLPDWNELSEMVRRWFAVEIDIPKYDSERDVHITVEYLQSGKEYDIIAGGSGFHQTLTLLAFLYGYHPTTILLEEPDAHLHANLQREILDFFQRKSAEKGIQFLIATHAEEFIRGTNAGQILSLLSRKPRRVDSSPEALRAMREVSNEEIVQLIASPFILYVEGESDERVLRAWADTCRAREAFDQIYFRKMHGGDKKTMLESAKEHFTAVKQIVPEIRRLMLFDYDSDKTAFHPGVDDPVLYEWKRKNIENYLLVPDAWKRAATRILGYEEESLFAMPVNDLIDGYFADQGLTLPKGRTWRDLDTRVIREVDGKKMLFEDDRSLFQQLRESKPSVKLPPEAVAMLMTVDEIHKDVQGFMNRLTSLVEASPDHRVEIE